MVRFVSFYLLTSSARAHEWARAMPPWQHLYNITTSACFINHCRKQPGTCIKINEPAKTISLSNFLSLSICPSHQDRSSPTAWLGTILREKGAGFRASVLLWIVNFGRFTVRFLTSACLNALADLRTACRFSYAVHTTRKDASNTE
jgi:hypothetical protein